MLPIDKLKEELKTARIELFDLEQDLNHVDFQIRLQREKVNDLRWKIKMLEKEERKKKND